MRTVQKFVFSIFLLICLSVSHAAEVAGVKIDDTLNFGGSQLTLNGAGIRYKAVFKVYVAALYVGKKSSQTQEILAQPGAKRISIYNLVAKF